MSNLSTPLRAAAPLDDAVHRATVHEGIQQAEWMRKYALEWAPKVTPGGKNVFDARKLDILAETVLLLREQNEHLTAQLARARAERDRAIMHGLEDCKEWVKEWMTPYLTSERAHTAKPIHALPPSPSPAPTDSQEKKA